MQGADGLWFAIMGLASLLIGVFGGALSWLGGLNIPNAILAGAGGFGAGLLLMIAARNYFSGRAG